MNTEPVSPMKKKEPKEPWDPGVVALGKVLIGLGCIGIVLWLSPYTLTDLFMVFGIPLLIIGALLFGTGIIGSGFLELVNSKQIGQKVQEYVKEQQVLMEAQ